MLDTLKSALKNYDTGKGVVRFSIDGVLPDSLVKKILKTREAEIKKRWPSAAGTHSKRT